MGSKHYSEEGEGSATAEVAAAIAQGTVTSRKQPPKAMEDYEAEEKKQAAGKSLLNYSQFVMTCIGEDVKPGQLRLHLMKEISGMPTALSPLRFVGADRTPVGPDRGQTSSQASGTLESLSTVEGSSRGKLP